MKLLIHFARLGPYHLLRMDSAAVALVSDGWEVTALEIARSDATYAWRADETDGVNWNRHTVFPNEGIDGINSSRLKHAIFAALDSIMPDVAVIAGWGSVDARACLDWCRKNGVKAIVMSETRKADGVRVWWKEWLKKRLIRRFDAALVGGKSQRDYLVELGIPAQRIQLGYNVVDNAYFAAESQKWRANIVSDDPTAHCSLTTDQFPPYFLASNRFIGRKNLARLIDAYALYLRRVSSPTTDNRQLTTAHWNLCLLGDGELMAELIAQCRALGLNVVESAPWDSSLTSDSCSSISDSVYFPGFRQIEELPRFYAHSGCFVHPALEEPWGLVLNEAMACGLPVLSGSNVGAAEELIVQGVNGWTFDAKRVEAITEGMTIVANLNPDQRTAMGNQSLRILAERCPTEAFGEGLKSILANLVVSNSSEPMVYSDSL